jgi:DNA-binding NarL/FixJ family response regulator
VIDVTRKKTWSEDDEIYLEYYLYSGEERNYNSAAEFLNKSNKNLISKANKMRARGERLGYIRRPFSEKEIDYIKINYRNIPTKLMSEHLGRSRDTIIEKANELGLKKLTQLKDFDAEIRMLASQGKTRADIARLLFLNPKSVGDYVARNKIKCEYASREVMGKAFRDMEYRRHLKIFGPKNK